MRFPVSNWNLRIKESSFNGKWQELLHHYREMKRAGAPLTDSSVFHSILKACSNLSLQHGKSIHGCLIKQGFDSFTSIANSTLDFYMKWGELDSANAVFHCLESGDSISWNIMVHGNLSHGFSGEGLWWFVKGRLAGFEPNISTLVLVIQACKSLKSYHDGFKLHGYVIKGGFWVIISVQNSLLNFYTYLGMDYAHKLFDEMPEKDVISWSVMIGGYVQSHEAQAGLQVFRNMLLEALAGLDGVIIVSVLKACASLGDVRMGRSVHGLVIIRGLGCDLFVGNSLINMYSKCNDADASFKVFNEMSYMNIVSWNSMLSTFVLNEKHEEALSLLYMMVEDGLEADEVTLVNILHTCKHFVQPLHCKMIHCLTIRRGYESNELVLNALVDAYAKCSLIELAFILFDRMNIRDVVSWSSMIDGFTRCGMPDLAMAIFRKMNQTEVIPNEITIINLLEACTVSAELKRAKWAHGISVRRSLAPDVAVGAALINMYSKCGDIKASERVFDLIPEKNVVIWSAMVAAYGINGLAHEALALFKRMKENGVKPNGVTALSLLSACRHGGLVEEGLSSFTSMIVEQGVEPGLEHYSCVVDMLSRAGKLDIAVELIKKMPEGVEAGASVWGAILSACRSYGNSSVGEGAVSRVLELEPLNSAGYMIASGLYSAKGLMVDAARMRKMAKERGVKVIAGYSLVHADNLACKFVAGDKSHPQTDKIYFMVEQLHDTMKIENSSI